MASRPVDVPALVDAARAGTPRAVARLISLVEDGHPALPLLLVAALATG
jgi:LAO/AO transport system kinase